MVLKVQLHSSEGEPTMTSLEACSTALRPKYKKYCEAQSLSTAMTDALEGFGGMQSTNHLRHFVAEHIEREWTLVVLEAKVEYGAKVVDRVISALEMED
jgi:hypothetical protein